MTDSIRHSIRARAELALPYLRAIRETFADKSKWTQRTYARKGRELLSCRLDDAQASCWCVEGLALKLTPRTRIGEPSAFDAISMAITDADPGMRDIVTINDVGGYDDIMQALDRAIAKCEKDLEP